MNPQYTGIIPTPTPTPYKHFIPTPSPTLSIGVDSTGPSDVGITRVDAGIPALNWLGWLVGLAIILRLLLARNSE